MSTLELIAAHVRGSRRQHGLTQEALAGLAGISRGYLSEIECGKRNPSALVLLRILAALRSSDESA